MKLYVTFGKSHLVCPALLAIDPRHGVYRTKFLPCELGQKCGMDHAHSKPIPDGGGHEINLYTWVPGARPHTPDEHPKCWCGQTLVYSDLDDLYGEEHLVDVAE